MSRDEMNSGSEAVDEVNKERDSDLSSESTESSAQGAFRSSPPLPNTDQTAIEEPSAMNKKRSHDEIDIKDENMFASSATMVGDPASSAVPPKPADQSNSTKPSTSAQIMLPPPVPNSSMNAPFATTPTSAQISLRPELSKPGSAKPTLEHRQKAPSPEPESSPEMDDVDGAPSGPHDQIKDFDWRDLDQRYHNKMNELDQQESDALSEFQHLCQYFTSWSNAGGDREVDRSFKRFKTQTTYVQHEEGELEQKRLHYIKVVEAFKSALALLKS